MQKLVFCLTLMASGFMASVSFAQTMNSHDILRLVAAESCVPHTQPFAFQFVVPQNWTIQTQGADKLAFHVPYHTGVGGFVMTPAAQMTAEQVIADVTERTKIQFEKLSDAEFIGQEIKGSQSIYDGRFGGEVWRFIVVSASRHTGEPVVYFAQAPETWFDVYIQLFMDMAKSLGVVPTVTK